jgi:plastocyanin
VKATGLCLIAILAAAAAVPAAAAPQTHVVRIDRMKFGPMPASVRVGDRIIWVNQDMVRHTATARQAGLDADVPASAKATSVIRAAGTFRIVCRYHPGMVATLKVKE